MYAGCRKKRKSTKSVVSVSISQEGQRLIKEITSKQAPSAYIIHTATTGMMAYCHHVYSKKLSFPVGPAVGNIVGAVVSSISSIFQRMLLGLTPPLY